MNSAFLSKEDGAFSGDFELELLISPLMKKVKIINGMSKHTILGKMRAFIIPPAEISPPIQSIVVVTSPIGLQAPPAFAAITITPAM